MAAIKMRTQVSASAAELWKTIGGFNALPAWHPAIEKSESTGQTAGAVRTLRLAGGGTVIERLEHYSDVERVYRYTIIDSPLPVANYAAEIRVIDNGDGTSNVEWSSEFASATGSESDAVKIIQGIYQAGFDNLKKMFGG